MELSHVDSDGKARMVDVSAKAETEREARAFGRVRMSPDSYQVVRQGQGPKGDIFTVAKWSVDRIIIKVDDLKKK